MILISDFINNFKNQKLKIMNTVENTQIEKDVIIKGEELASRVKETLHLIDQIATERKYRWKNRTQYEQLLDLNWKHYLDKLSYNQIKKLNRSIYRINVKPSRHNINMFFHFLHTRVFAERSSSWWGTTFETPESFKKIVLEIPAKELAIQNKRKKWKELQAQADAALKEYKEEKGDYHKLRGF